jgi:hypothetical protein
VTLNPSAPLARHFLACVLEFSSRPAEAIPHIKTLLRLDPRYRFASLAVADKALCQFLLGDPAPPLHGPSAEILPSHLRTCYRRRLIDWFLDRFSFLTVRVIRRSVQNRTLSYPFSRASGTTARSPVLLMVMKFVAVAQAGW